MLQTEPWSSVRVTGFLGLRKTTNKQYCNCYLGFPPTLSPTTLDWSQSISVVINIPNIQTLYYISSCYSDLPTIELFCFYFMTNFES